MTITLTVEEVKNYVSAMNYWQALRATAAIKTITALPIVQLDADSLARTLMQKMPEWDAANPMPTLISSHFGALVPKVTEQQKQPIKG